MVMFEEASAVPLIMSGPDISSGICKAPVSLIDIYATVLDLVSIKKPNNLPSHTSSLLNSIDKPNLSRPIISEFHDYGAQTGMFMLRHENWKSIIYPGFRSQLFDLNEDPYEINDLALDNKYSDIVQKLYEILNAILDPQKVNQKAFQDQERKIRELGGRQNILATENYDHTPVL